MRFLTDHIVSGDPSNQLRIEALDVPGAGGASHEYEVSGFFHSGDVPAFTRVSFQNGPIKEVGVNGITHEVLLSIVIDRLRSFQKGPYSCRENAIALTHCEDALMWLQRRTAERIKGAAANGDQR